MFEVGDLVKVVKEVDVPSWTGFMNHYVGNGVAYRIEDKGFDTFLKTGERLRDTPDYKVDDYWFPEEALEKVG